MAPTEFKRVPTASPPFSVSTLRKAIPAHCFERSVLKSSAYLAADLAGAAFLYVCSTFIPSAPAAWQWLLWPAYWWLQGAVCTGLWVIAHECGHQVSHTPGGAPPGPGIPGFAAYHPPHASSPSPELDAGGGLLLTGRSAGYRRRSASRRPSMTAWAWWCTRACWSPTTPGVPSLPPSPASVDGLSLMSISACCRSLSSVAAVARASPVVQSLVCLH